MERDLVRSQSVAEPSTFWRKPSHPSLASLRGSVDSYNTPANGDLRRSSATKLEGKARSSSDGSTRGHGGKRISDIAASTGVALRQNRSESDPTRTHTGSRERSQSESNSRPFFDVGYRPVAKSTSAQGHGETGEEGYNSNARVWASSGQSHRGSINSSDPLARVEERDSSLDVSFASQSAAAKHRFHSDVLPRGDDERSRQERINHEKSPRLPFLGRRPSPVAVLVDQPGIYATEGEQPPSVFPPWASRGANDMLDSPDEEISFNSAVVPPPFSKISLPRSDMGTKSPSLSSDRSDAVALSESVRRKMQRLGLGMRFKALQAEKRIKKTFASGAEADGKRQGSEE
jgi:hypothetical protein